MLRVFSWTAASGSSALSTTSAAPSSWDGFCQRDLSAWSALLRAIANIQVETCDLPSKRPGLRQTEKHLAHDILAQRGIAGDAQDEAVDARAMPREQLFQRFPVAAGNRLDQHLVRLRPDN